MTHALPLELPSFARIPNLTFDAFANELHSWLPDGSPAHAILDRQLVAAIQALVVPAHNAPAGVNNSGQAEMALCRWKLRNEQAALDYGLGWIRGAYLVDMRDGGHRYGLGNVLAALYGPTVESRTLGRTAAYLAADASIASLVSYRGQRNGAGAPRIRYCALSIMNVALGAYMAHVDGNPTKRDGYLLDVAKYVDWFCNYKPTIPPFDYFMGWAKTTTGEWLQGDFIDRAPGFGVIGSPVSLDYQMLSTQYVALNITRQVIDHVVDILAETGSESELVTFNLISVRIGALRNLFWRYRYNDADFVLSRGTGPTQSSPMTLASKDGGATLTLAHVSKLKVIVPTEKTKVGDPLPTGTMLYPYWHMLEGLKGEERRRHRGRILEATVLQINDDWRGYGEMFLYQPTLLLEAELSILEKNPPMPEIPMSKAQRMTESIQLARGGGKFDAEADLMRACIEYTVKAATDGKQIAASAEAAGSVASSIAHTAAQLATEAAKAPSLVANIGGDVSNMANEAIAIQKSYAQAVTVAQGGTQ